MFERTCGFESRPRHHVENQVSLDAGGNLKSVCRALVAQRIERSPAKAEVVGSNPAKRAIFFCPGDEVSLTCGCDAAGNRAGRCTARKFAVGSVHARIR